MGKRHYKIVQADCVGFMENDLSDGCVDLVLTSPPYDNLRKYNVEFEWSASVWEPIIRNIYSVVKPGGVVVWVVGDATINGDETASSLKQALYFKESGFKLHDTMIYQKPGSGMPQRGAHRYGQSFEYMFVFSKGRISGRGEIEKFPETGKTGKTTRRGRDGIIRNGIYIKKEVGLSQIFGEWLTQIKLSILQFFHMSLQKSIFFPGQMKMILSLIRLWVRGLPDVQQLKIIDSLLAAKYVAIILK